MACRGGTTNPTSTGECRCSGGWPAAEPGAALKMSGTAGATDSVALLGEPSAASPPPAAKKPSSKPKKKEKANRALKRAAGSEDSVGSLPDI